MGFSPQEIKNLRLKLMMTQTEFAKLAGVSFPSINRYENGKSKSTFKVQRKLTELKAKMEED
jgi:DNA-binding XRE family transcriptional regulator